MRRVWVVFAKEVVDNLRDRRSISVALLYPFIGPILVGAMIAFVGETISEFPTSSYTLPVEGAEHAPQLMAYFEARGVTVAPAPADPAVAVREGSLEAVLVIPEDFAARFAANRPVSLDVIVDRSRLSSMLAMNRAALVLREFNGEVSRQRLESFGVDPTALNPLRAETVNVATGRSLTGFFLNTMPPFIMFTIFLGGMYLTIDTTSGERERGSLEPLLTNPIARWELLVGKVGAALLFTATAVAVQLAAFKVMFDLITAETVNLMDSPGVGVFVGVFLICLPLMLLAVALQVIIATMTRSFKETQTYLGVLPMVPSLPGLILVFVAVKADSWMMLVPTFNQTLLIGQLVRGEPVTGLALTLASLSTLAAALLLLYGAARLYQRDVLVFGGS